MRHRERGLRQGKAGASAAAAGGLVEAMKAYVAGKMPDARLFHVPGHKRSAAMIRVDLAAARSAWIAESQTSREHHLREQSDFCAYQDAKGEFLDFHALRHTRGTWLFEQHKAHPREVQDLMGVSSLSLVDRYTRFF